MIIFAILLIINLLTVELCIFRMMLNNSAGAHSDALLLRVSDMCI